MIICQNLHVKKGENIVLKELDLELPWNQNVGIIGDNGSGKSTLLDVIAGKIFPFQGRIKKPNHSEIELVPRDYGFHRIVGAAYQYYQQRYHAHDSEIGPTVEEVIQNQIVPIGTIDAKSIDVSEQIYDSVSVGLMAEKLNISHLLKRKVTSLSNGETRRTLIAIALLKGPKLLLLDNPFVGLDSQSKESLKGLLDEIDVQIILVARLNDMPKSINRVLVLKNGKLENDLNRPFPESKGLIKKFEWNESLLTSFSTSPSENGQSIIKLVNGRVVYHEKSVLYNVNWEVFQGEKWALLGANGSGKSTLISLLTGDNPQAYQNELYLFGKRRGSGESIWDIKRRIGYVSPEMHLYFPKNMKV